MTTTEDFSALILRICNALAISLERWLVTSGDLNTLPFVWYLNVNSVILDQQKTKEDI